MSGRLDRTRTKETYEVAAAIVTATGVLLTLIATKTFRSSIENLRSWTASRNVSEPVGVVVETEAARVVIDAKVRGKAKPGAEDWSDKRWHAGFDGRIDSLAAELDRHDHKKTTRSIEQLRAADEEIRADLDSKLEDLEGDLATADRWHVFGLALVLFGAIIQVIAAFV